jgi:transcriptional regulator with XRE-family HTH domain
MSTTLRAVRTQLRLSQVEFAARLEVSVDSLRVWDSGRRPPPADILERADALLRDPDEQVQPLRTLAARFDVHVRTLRAAARDGRLRATFANRAFFGRPVALATGRAVAEFLDERYGKSAKCFPDARALVSGATRLRRANRGDSTASWLEPSRTRPSCWRGEQGCRLSVGSGQAPAITRVLDATDQVAATARARLLSVKSLGEAQSQKGDRSCESAPHVAYMRDRRIHERISHH